MKHAAIAAVLALGLMATPALPHDWFDPWCCNGQDCAEIADGRVKVLPDGYEITIRPGDHPMAKTTIVHKVAFKDTRVSKTGKHAACLFPDETVMRCFYAAVGGS